MAKGKIVNCTPTGRMAPTNRIRYLYEGGGHDGDGPAVRVVNSRGKMEYITREEFMKRARLGRGPKVR